MATKGWTSTGWWEAYSCDSCDWFTPLESCSESWEFRFKRWDPWSWYNDLLPNLTVAACANGALEVPITDPLRQVGEEVRPQVFGAKSPILSMQNAKKCNSIIFDASIRFNSEFGHCNSEGMNTPDAHPDWRKYPRKRLSKCLFVIILRSLYQHCMHEGNQTHTLLPLCLRYSLDRKSGRSPAVDNYWLCCYWGREYSLSDDAQKIVDMLWPFWTHFWQVICNLSQPLMTSRLTVFWLSFISHYL